MKSMSRFPIKPLLATWLPGTVDYQLSPTITYRNGCIWYLTDCIILRVWLTQNAKAQVSLRSIPGIGSWRHISWQRLPELSEPACLIIIGQIRFNFFYQITHTRCQNLSTTLSNVTSLVERDYDTLIMVYGKITWMFETSLTSFYKWCFFNIFEMSGLFLMKDCRLLSGVATGQPSSLTG